MTIQIGLVSDTHGLLRPEVVDRLQGADMILHAGDIGSDAVLSALNQIAPVTAIRGNVDRKGGVAELPDIASVNIEGLSIYILHNLDDLKINPVTDGIHLILSGHSHQPRLTRHDGVIYLNPGSIGPRRFRLPISMAWLSISASDTAELADRITTELIEIKI